MHLNRNNQIGFLTKCREVFLELLLTIVFTKVFYINAGAKPWGLIRILLRRSHIGLTVAILQVKRTRRNLLSKRETSARESLYTINNESHQGVIEWQFPFLDNSAVPGSAGCGPAWSGQTWVWALPGVPHASEPAPHRCYFHWAPSRSYHQLPVKPRRASMLHLLLLQFKDHTFCGNT